MVPPSPVLHRKAEHRNSDEDGQDDIGDDCSHQNPGVDHVAMATCCERDERFELFEPKQPENNGGSEVNLPG